MTSPKGRAEVKRALLDAAAELLAERGPEAVSVRDVAARAVVNHGLVHRHFGSKRELVRAVMADLTSKLAAEVQALPATTMPSALATTAEASVYWRVLARALLDGIDPRELQGGFPVVRMLLERAAEAQRAGLLRRDVDARLLTATGLALGLGWLLFEPFVLAATGLRRRDRARLRGEALSLYFDYLTPTPSP